MIQPTPSLTRPLCNGSLAARVPCTLSTPPPMAPALKVPWSPLPPIAALRLHSTSTLPATSPLTSQVILWQTCCTDKQVSNVTYPAIFGDLYSPIVLVEWTLCVAVYSLMYIYMHWQVLYRSGVPLRPFLWRYTIVEWPRHLLWLPGAFLQYDILMLLPGPTYIFTPPAPAFSLIPYCS